MKTILKFFDSLEDKIRGKLSRWPISYAFIGGAGVIIFWRGIWHGMDYLTQYFTQTYFYTTESGLVELVWWDGPLSILIGMLLLLPTGVFVSSFIGNEIIISGVKGEKKLTEKTEEEVAKEMTELIQIKKEMKEIKELLEKK